jgi:hypothetical protein
VSRKVKQALKREDMDLPMSKAEAKRMKWTAVVQRW